MVKKIIKTSFIQLCLPMDLKNILDRRALRNHLSLESEIINLIKNGLSEQELMQEHAGIFIQRVLEARTRKKQKNLPIQKRKKLTYRMRVKFE